MPVNTSVQTPVIEEIITLEAVPSDVTSDKGKVIQEASVRTRAQPLVIPETTQKEMEEILKIIKKSDYDIVEQLGKPLQKSLRWPYCSVPRLTPKP